MVRHISSIAEIVDNVDAAVKFYQDVLGLAVRREDEGYAIIEVSGVLHFGIWSRAAAAESTFGDPGAADRIPVGFTVGFEVDDVAGTSRSMADRSWAIAQAPKEEPWGQKTSRFFSPSGALCEIAETPNARSIVQDMRAEAEGR